MKKIFLLLALAVMSLKTFSQGWQATNVTNVIYLANTGIESHKGKLYATLFNGSTAYLLRLKSNNTAWDTIPTGSITVPRFLRSAGTRLYMSSIASGFASLMYYSQNGGSTFTLDTAGLPKSIGNNVSMIYGLQYYNGKIFANLGAGGYWVKDTAAASWHAIPVPTALNGGADPITYVNDTLFAYDNTGTNTLYVSGDFGTTWHVRTTDLPTGYGTNVITTNPATGRIYSAGAWNSNANYGLYYSDNNGRNWTLAANANAFISKNANNTQQLITAMYANGNTFYMALENNKNASAPNVVGTTTGLANLAYDTLGLPVNASGAAKGQFFVEHNNYLALQLNAIDNYLSNFQVGIHEPVKETSSIVLSPNPAHDHLYFSNANNTTFTKVNVMSIDGKVILSKSGMIKDLDVSNLPKGIYLVELFAGKETFKAQKFIKD